ncbi:MAG: DUF4340 domain-containing protein [Anaerolineales bacterium]|nr:DUF4340 domain-containing protein [Anaerolineales bacterium]
MLRRSTLIVLIVFLVLVGVAVYVQYFREEAPAPTEEALVLDATVPVYEDLFDFDPTAVTGLRIDAADGRALVIEKNEDGAFVLVEPETSVELTDAVRIFDAIDTLARVEITFDLDPQIGLDALGLDDPDYEVTLSLEDGEEVDLLIGDQTPPKTGYYVQLAGDSPKAVSMYAIDNLLAFFDDPPAMPTPTPEPEITPEPQEVE